MTWRELSLLSSKNNIGTGRLWSEKWGESRGRGNYSGPISMHAALIKYSHRKLGPRSNASGRVPDGQPAKRLRKLFGHADSNKDKRRLPLHPANHSLRPSSTGSKTETRHRKSGHAFSRYRVSASFFLNDSNQEAHRIRLAYFHIL